jgi:hypothetical protein
MKNPHLQKAIAAACAIDKTIKHEEMVAVCECVADYYLKKLIKVKEQSDLERRWFDSLKKGSPDYGVYDSCYYLPELWSGFGYARTRINMLSKFLAGTNIKTIADLGCGWGLTTLMFSEKFPQADVFGTNLKHTLQAKIATKLGVEIKSRLDRYVDLVCAFEYFEHFYDVSTHLKTITKFKPRYIATANSFGAVAIGHFPKYKFNRVEVINKSGGREFGKLIRTLGYEKVETGFFNGRPALWKYVGV